jgi:DNA processing protein
MATSLQEQATVLALAEASPREWYRTADVIADNGSAVRLIEGVLAPMSSEQRDYANDLRAQVHPDAVEQARALIERVTGQGVQLITVLDDDYPLNLQLIYNRPPFVWVRGQLEARNMRAIAVVGTRRASTQGRATAATLARELSEAGVTIVSGLARGIDTAAHSATLDAGGRTVAVIGTGILAPTYPPDNADLAHLISERGALVSQFWPDAAPRRGNFPLRNVVMSGLAAGTVVVEASATSGAKMQARFALEHGKRLFLPQQLLAEEWAKGYANRPGVTVVRTPDDILDALARLVDIPQQLPLAL